MSYVYTNKLARLDLVTVKTRFKLLSPFSKMVLGNMVLGSDGLTSVAFSDYCGVSFN